MSAIYARPLSTLAEGLGDVDLTMMAAFAAVLAGCGTIAALGLMLRSTVHHAAIPPQVFVSYSQADREFAEQLVSRLRSRGVNVKKAEDTIRVGDDISDRIRELIAECTHAIIVASADYEQSRWQAAELVMMDSRIKIVPILYKRSKPLPGLETIQHALADSVNDELIDELVAALPHMSLGQPSADSTS